MWWIKKLACFKYTAYGFSKTCFPVGDHIEPIEVKKLLSMKKTHIVRMILVSIFPWYNGPLWSSQLFIAYEICFRNIAWIKIQNIHFLGLRRALLLSLALAITLFCLSFTIYWFFALFRFAPWFQSMSLLPYHHRKQFL